MMSGTYTIMIGTYVIMIIAGNGSISMLEINQGVQTEMSRNRQTRGSTRKEHSNNNASKHCLPRSEQLRTITEKRSELSRFSAVSLSCCVSQRMAPWGLRQSTDSARAPARCVSKQSKSDDESCFTFGFGKCRLLSRQAWVSASIFSMNGNHAT
jgi:hypothetical protein